MYQRHDPREQHRPGRNDHRDYDEWQHQDQFDDDLRQPYYQRDNSQRDNSGTQYQPPQQQQPQERRFRYTGSATTNAARRYQDQWSPDWMTRGGAPEYRRNSSGQGEMYGLRQETSWDSDSLGQQQQHRGIADHQNERNFGTSSFGEQPVSGYGSGYNRGEFAGKGPKGYTRADLRMEEDINEQLTRHSELDATDIEVSVKEGVATLTGTVRTKQCKRTAEDLAEDVSGIKEVNNQLRVVPSQLLSSTVQQPNQQSQQDSSRQWPSTQRGGKMH
ncbi:transport-associated protein [Bryobacterales bacterium F-183]|nr:transport-associated protein [Bryobacterales bacterium F-183]